MYGRFLLVHIRSLALPVHPALVWQVHPVTEEVVQVGMTRDVSWTLVLRYPVLVSDVHESTEQPLKE